MNVMLYTDPDWTETQYNNFASNDGSIGSAEQVGGTRLRMLWPRVHWVGGREDMAVILNFIYN